MTKKSQPVVPSRRTDGFEQYLRAEKAVRSGLAAFAGGRFGAMVEEARQDFAAADVHQSGKSRDIPVPDLGRRARAAQPAFQPEMQMLHQVRAGKREPIGDQAGQGGGNAFKL